MTFADLPCYFPGTLEQALDWMAEESTRGRPLAGGTDLMVQWEAGAVALPARVISIKHLAELKGISEQDGSLQIGGGVTHWELRHSEIVQRWLPSLAAAAATVGGRQIQTMGTIAGNVANASPAGDLAPSLLITDGTVRVASSKTEREIPLSKFWVGYRKIDLQPDELIVGFRLPKCPEGHHECWRKLGPRQAQAISKVMGSCRGQVTDGVVRSFKVALGSMAPTAIRLGEIETWLEGQRVNEALLTELEQRVSALMNPISDIRSSAPYRKWVSGRLVRFFVEQLAGH
jgi:CO/xanthine dehydrogenase FAD-binding subunit